MKTEGIAIERIDFPQRKKMSSEQIEFNSFVAEKYSFDGQYPTLILARNDKLLFSKLSYLNQSVDEMIDDLNSTIKILTSE